MRPYAYIVEGPDGAGKSTLIEYIHENVESGSGREYSKVHMKGTDPMTYPFLKEMLRKKNVIWDRHFVSENIYSDLYKKPRRLAEDDRERLLQYTFDNNIPIIILLPSEYILDEDEDKIIKKEHHKLVARYKSFVAEALAKGFTNVHYYNRFEDDFNIADTGDVEITRKKKGNEMR